MYGSVKSQIKTGIVMVKWLWNYHINTSEAFSASHREILHIKCNISMSNTTKYLNNYSDLSTNSDANGNGLWPNFLKMCVIRIMTRNLPYRTHKTSDQSWACHIFLSISTLNYWIICEYNKCLSGRTFGFSHFWKLSENWHHWTYKSAPCLW